MVPPPPPDAVMVVLPQKVPAPLNVTIAGNGLTVTTLVAVHPVPTVYAIVDVPAATPVTTPVPETVAFAVLLLLHTPPAVASLKVVVEPLQTLVAPAIAAGEGVIVTTTLPSVPQQPLADCDLK